MRNPCNPNPARIIKPTAGNNVLRLMFIVNLNSVYDCRSYKSILNIKTSKRIIAMYYKAKNIISELPVHGDEIPVHWGK